MTELTESKILELKQAHGEICAVEVAGQTLVFRKPSPAEYDRWYDGYSNGQQKSLRSKELAVSTLVFPSRDALEKAIKDRPAALTTTIDSEIIKLAGAGSDDSKPVKL